MRLWGSLASSLGSKRWIPSLPVGCRCSQRGEAGEQEYDCAADETMMRDIMPADSNMIIPWVWQKCMPHPCLSMNQPYRSEE